MLFSPTYTNRQRSCADSHALAPPRSHAPAPPLVPTLLRGNAYRRTPLTDIRMGYHAERGNQRDEEMVGLASPRSHAPAPPRSHVPAWECIPDSTNRHTYGLPRGAWEPGVGFELIRLKSTLQSYPHNRFAQSLSHLQGLLSLDTLIPFHAIFGE